MGSIAFFVDNQLPSVKIIDGRPQNVFFPEDGVVQYSRCAGVNYSRIPDELRRVYRGMEINVPPSELILSSAEQQLKLLEDDRKFGYRKPGVVREVEWCPTSLLVNGVRAWVLHYRLREKKGSLNRGNIIDDLAVKGAFFYDEPLRKWAEKLFKHPLGRLIEIGEGKTGRVYAPAGSNPKLWPDVHLKRENFSFTSADDYSVKKGGAKAGVYREFSVKWGLWEGEVLVYLPDYWQVTIRWEYEYPVRYPFLFCTNGYEERKVSPHYFSLEEDLKFISRWSHGHKVEYVTVNELPNLPEFVPPLEASGEYATFWPSLVNWQTFARRHNIRASLHFLSNLKEDESGGLFIPLKRDFAELAWEEGATMLPPVIEEITLNKMRHLGSSIYIAQSNRWIAARPGIKVAFGHTVRSLDDKTIPHSTETVVYRNGLVKLPNKLFGSEQ
jgi:hypothetical protein